MKFASLFCDHAVLQRDVPLRLWGTGGIPGAPLTLSLVGDDGDAVSSTFSKVNPDGSFRFILPPVAAGGPYSLVASTGSGEVIRSVDIMVGEVWIASGQSNMAFELRDASPRLDGLPDDCLRCFRPADDIGFGERSEARGTWLAATTENASGFSAVGIFFASRLRRELGVAVGVICAANGGTRIEAWMSRQALAATVAGRCELSRFARCLSDPKCNAAGSAPESQPLDPGPDAESIRRAGPGFDDSGWGTVRLPANFSNLEGRDFNGAVWFRKTVRIPPTMVGKELLLRIPGVDKHDIAYVNGVEVGRTGRGFETEWYATERFYRVPAGLVTTEDIVIAIRVWSFIYAGGIGTADGDFSLSLDEDGSFVDLYGDWRWHIEFDYGRVAGGVSGMVAGNCNSPHALFDAKIAPLVPYAIRGVIWYQGEDNSNNAEDYGELLGALVRDWRYRWGQGDFPFIAVQLAGYGAKAEFNRRSGWSEVRDAMRRLSLTLPSFGIVSALDVGSETEIHPKDKKTVGMRLADWALCNVFGRDDIVPTGPRFVSAVRDGNGVMLEFDNVGQGLRTKDDVSLSGFFVADANGVFRPALAEIVGPTRVRVSMPENVAASEVRYAWAKNPSTANLLGSTGLPASPFRT